MSKIKTGAVTPGVNAKKESLEKAFLRLKEIALEENKDPFKD